MTVVYATTDSEIQHEGQILMRYLRARSEFIDAAGAWFASYESPPDIKGEMEFVSDAVQTLAEKIRDDDPPPPDPQPQQPDLMGEAGGGADG